MFSFIALLCAFPVLSQSPAWQRVSEAIDDIDLIPNCMLTVKDANGILYRHTKGHVNEHTPQAIWSSTKLIVGTAIMKEAQDGNLDLDVRLSSYLDYWATDPEDSRSGITLRHLLGFASGYTDPTQSQGYLIPLACVLSDLQACARAVYDNNNHDHLPGTLIDYNSIHLTLAGAAVERATGKRALDIVRDNVWTPSGMRNTRFLQNDNAPFLAGGIESNSEDYLLFLDAFTKHQLIRPETQAEMLVDAFPDAVKSGIFEIVRTRYGLTNWYECPQFMCTPPNCDHWDQECRSALIHSSPGASGSYPLIDNRLGYYYYFGWDQLLGSGALISATFRDVLKPLVDAAVTGDFKGSQRLSTRLPNSRLECLEAAQNRTSGHTPVSAWQQISVGSC